MSFLLLFGSPAPSSGFGYEPFGETPFGGSTPAATEFYIPTTDDVGSFIRCIVTARNSFDGTAQASLPTTRVSAAVTPPPPPPAGTTTPFYVPSVLDVGYFIRCLVTASNSTGTGAAASNSVGQVVAQQPPDIPPNPDPVPTPTPSQIVGHFVQPIHYTIQVGWQVASGNLAIVGSALVGVGVVGETFFDQVFGPGDDVTDVCLSPVSISRGRDDPTSTFLASTATFKLLDPDGTYNPKNENSDLSGLIRPLRQVRITAHFGGLDYPRFAGFVREIQWEPHGRGGIATIDCVDLLSWLQRYSPTIAPVPITTTGAAIGMILDAVGWTIARFRSLAVGDSILNFTADGSKTALQLIEDLLEAERGIFYINPDGVATYKDRQTKNEQVTPRFTISKSMVGMAPGVSLDSVKNTATVTGLDNVPQVSIDPASVLLYGKAEWPNISSPYINNAAQAASLADYLVAIGKNPKAPVWGFQVRNETFGNVAAILAMDLDDLLAIDEPQGDTSGNFFVEGYTEEINKDANLHQLTLSLSERTRFGGAGGGGVALVGTATVDGPDVVGF